MTDVAGVVAAIDRKIAEARANAKAWESRKEEAETTLVELGLSPSTAKADYERLAGEKEKLEADLEAEIRKAQEWLTNDSKD